MITKKFLCWMVLIGLLLAVLTGCSTESGSTKSPFAGRHDDYGMYIGNLPESAAALPLIEFDRQKTSCTYLGKNYEKVSLPTLEKCGSGDCFWQLDCNYLTPMGKTTADETVYAVYGKEQEILSLLFVGTDIYNLTVDWFVLDAADVLDLSSYSFSDFSVQNMSEEKNKGYSYKEIWKYHTLSEEMETSYLMVTDPDMYKFFYRSKENPWLVYELNCMVLYEGHLYIYSPYNKGSIIIEK